MLALVLVLAALAPVQKRAEPKPAAPRFDPSELAAPRADETDARIACALVTAMGGDFEAAVAELETLGAGSHAQRVATELARMRAWIELRDAWLAELVRSQAPLKIELGQSKLSAPIKSITDGEIELATPSGGLQRFPVTALDPQQVAQLAKDAIPSERAWLAIYPYCVTGNAKWKRLTIASASPELTALKSDAASFYPAAWRAGSAMKALSSLVAAGWPPPAELAQQRLDQLTAVWNEYRDLEPVAARAPAIRLAARELLALLASQIGLSRFVRAAVTELDGNVRLTYAFDRAAELDDFVRDDGYLARHRTKLAPAEPKGDAAKLLITDGMLFGSGVWCYRHAFEFEAPMVVRYRLRWQSVPDKPSDVFTFCVGLCGDAKEQHLRCQGVSSLWIFDGQEAEHWTALDTTGTIADNQFYAFEIRHDGRHAEVWIDGKRRGAIEVGGRRTGRVFLWLHSNLRVAISDFEIEGRLAAGALDRHRAEWVERRLAEVAIE